MPKSQERCQEIREETRNLIIRKSVLYFAKNGFDGTKISDLSRHIGIAQGTIYIYFKSKEELYSEIFSI
ncbi:MAG: helix-turn-helix domain-containing protein, partial [Lachnospiraceae bacterium]